MQDVAALAVLLLFGYQRAKNLGKSGFTKVEEVVSPKFAEIGVKVVNAAT